MLARELIQVILLVQHDIDEFFENLSNDDGMI